MTAIKLPGQLELPTVIDHAAPMKMIGCAFTEPRDVRLAKLLLDYENRPTSETWSRIQALANEILK